MLYVVKYSLRDDPQHILTQDQTYRTMTAALDAAMQLEMDPEIYTAWHEQVLNEGYILESMREVLE